VDRLVFEELEDVRALPGALISPFFAAFAFQSSQGIPPI
jgi:hypothetical protein